MQRWEFAQLFIMGEYTSVIFSNPARPSIGTFPREGHRDGHMEAMRQLGELGFALAVSYIPPRTDVRLDEETRAVIETRVYDMPVLWFQRPIEEGE